MRRWDPCAIDAYLRAVYSFTREGLVCEFTFVPASLAGARAMRLEVATPWAIVSACNPMSRPLARAENEARMRELATMLQRRGVAGGPAGGRSADGKWTEPSRVVFGMAREEVLEIARRFAQRAVVWGGTSGVGILDCLSERVVVRPVHGLVHET